MKTDIKGRSTCPVGEERYESFTYKKGLMVQYDYRHTNGNLFSCVANNLEEARQKRDNWLKEQEGAI